MDRHVVTNYGVYKAIADEAYQEMVQLIEFGRRPNPDGSAGTIVTFDPNQKSFKKSMISIAFTGFWLEALMHLLIVKNFGEDKFRKFNQTPYEKKLRLLGCKDEELLRCVSRFRSVRNSLVHENAHFKQREIIKAQDEAENANKMLVAIHNHFSEQLGQQ